MDAEGSENTLEATGEDSNAQSEQQETGSGDNSNAKFQEALTSFRDHLPRLMQCGHTLCSKCLGLRTTFRSYFININCYFLN